MGDALLPEISSRKALRALGTREVSEEVLRRLAEAATLAPSCGNAQPWRLVFVTRRELRVRVCDAFIGRNYWAERAPCYVVVATDPELGCRLDLERDYALFDAGAAVQNLLLQATREGVIAHPISGYDEAAVKRALEIPERYIAISVVVLGYAVEDDELLSAADRRAERGPRERKAIGEVAWFNRWGETGAP